MTHYEIDPAAEARRALETALYECKRVVVGQDAMLERLLVALLTGGHVLLEGVPGLAKTLTVRTLATVLAGSFRRIQFTPDLVPADLVGTRLWQPGDGSFRTELGPVFANLLLADEINRAPAKVQSALLEVMQEHQVTIGGETHRVPEPFLVLATQNPAGPLRLARWGRWAWRMQGGDVSSSARARARRSGSSRPPGRSPCCAAARTWPSTTCATWRPTCSATGSCSPTTRSPTACGRTR